LGYEDPRDLSSVGRDIAYYMKKLGYEERFMYSNTHQIYVFDSSYFIYIHSVQIIL